MTERVIEILTCFPISKLSLRETVNFDWLTDCVSEWLTERRPYLFSFAISDTVGVSLTNWMTYWKWNFPMTRSVCPLVRPSTRRSVFPSVFHEILRVHWVSLPTLLSEHLLINGLTCFAQNERAEDLPVFLCQRSLRGKGSSLREGNRRIQIVCKQNIHLLTNL